jgi:hypothetical protein
LFLYHNRLLCGNFSVSLFRAHPTLLHRDLLAMQACRERLSEKVYYHLVRANGYASLEAPERKLKGQGGQS